MPNVIYPPGPRERFPGESLLAFNRDPIGFLLRLARDYGDVAYFRMGYVRIYLLSHPDLVQDLLVTHNKMFVQGLPRRRAKPLIGNGLILTEGEAHLHKRRLFAPIFHRQHIETFASDIVCIGAEGIRRWQPGVQLDVAHELWKLTLQITAKTLFNTDVASEAEELSQAIDEVSNLFNPLVVFLAPLLTRFPNPLWNRFLTIRARLYAKIDRIIAEHREERGQGDVLAMLLDAQYDEQGHQQMSDGELRDEALETFMAGYGTLSLALAWTCYLLSQNPVMADQLQDEVKTVLGGRLPTVADMKSLKYTRMVLAEAMRLYPPTWALDRENVADYPVRGYVIPTGSLVIVSQWATHHDPRWFPDPFRFDPLRFTPEGEATRPAYAYFPFGGGPRICVGEQLAWMEGVLLLALIVQQWRFVAPPGYDPGMRPRFSLESDKGIWLTLEQQQNREHE